MSYIVSWVCERIPDFGRGYGLALFFGMPIWALVIASRRQDFFEFSATREIIAIALWLTGLFALIQLAGLANMRIKKVTKDGIEFEYDAQPISLEKTLNDASFLKENQ